jgi:hypothetical protein
MRIWLDLPVTLARGQSTFGGVSGLVNCFAEPIKGEGRSRMAVYPMPGKTLFSTIGGGAVRGQADFVDYHFATVGDRLYSISSTGVATDQGEIVGVDRTDMDFNGSQLFIQGIVKSYVVTDPALGTPTEVTDGDFLGASSACSVNGYTITSVPDSDQFQWFNLRDAPNIDALDFATAESNGDINVAVRVANEDLHIFGTKTVEFFYNSGNPNQQFEAKSIPPLEIGCLARDSIVLCDTGFLWVGRDGKSGGKGVYRMAGGYSARKVSTPAVDRLLEEYPDASISTIHAQAFQYHAHLFYCLHLPGVASVAYDLATQDQWVWMRSGPYPITDEPLGGWDAISFATNGQNRIVGAADGNLYKLDGTVNTENGNEIIREIIFPQRVAGSDHGAVLHKMGLDMEVGVGSNGSDPQVMAAISKTGGKTWRQLTPRSAGASGEYRKKVFWDRLGQFDNVTPRVRMTDNARFNAFSAYLDVEELA